jgi:type IV secretion system protein VirD4
LRGLAKIAQRPEKTHGGMLDQLTNTLAPLRNPIVDFATSANSFDLRKLRELPMSIYLTVLRPDLPALSSLISLFYQQLVDLNMTVEFGHDPAHRHEVLLGMDEIAQLGKLDSIFNSMPLFRSYGIRLLAILQAMAQWRDTLGENGAKTVEGCFDCSVFFTPAARDLETAKTLSELLGTDTVKGRSESKRKGFDTAHDSATTSDQRRSLMLPQEILRMPLRKQVVLISGMAPIYCDKIKTWKDGTLLTRNAAPPSTPKMDITAIKPHVADISHTVELIIDRPIEASDMGELEALTLDDFSCDFSGIDVPQGKLNNDEIAALRDRFLDALTVERA